MDKRCGWFLVLIFPLSALAQTPLIVEEVIGRKATVYVPVNVELKPGDMLVPDGFAKRAATAPAAPAAPVAATAAVVVPPSAPVPTVSEAVCADGPSPVLRGRNHNLSLTYDSGKTKVSIKAPVNLEASETSGKLTVTYGYDVGYLRPIVSVGSNVSKDDNSPNKSEANSLMLGVRVNFIKNEPGNDLIPYALAGVGRYSEAYKSGATDLAINGSVGGVEVGLTWYPFGQLFAFEVSYYSWTADLTAAGSTADANTTITRSALAVGSVLSF